MTSITAAIITLNEENNIRQALESVKWADELVVVDSGSGDRTVKICKEYTDRVFYNPWPGFVKQKNFAVKKSSQRWILSIDADERVSPALAEEIQHELKNPSADAYSMPRKAFYLGRWIKHSGWYPDRKVRLFRKDKGIWSGGDLHEGVIVRGSTGRLNEDLLHYTYRGISQQVRTMNNFTDISSEEYFKKKKGGLGAMVFRPGWSFFKKYFLKQGFRDGVPGFIIAVSTAYYVFLKYAKTWELKNKLD